MQHIIASSQSRIFFASDELYSLPSEGLFTRKQTEEEQKKSTLQDERNNDSIIDYLDPAKNLEKRLRQIDPKVKKSPKPVPICPPCPDPKPAPPGVGVDVDEEDESSKAKRPKKSPKTDQELLDLFFGH